MFGALGHHLSRIRQFPRPQSRPLSQARLNAENWVTAIPQHLGKPRSTLLATTVVSFLIFAVQTLVLLQRSKIDGRLSAPPGADDVLYFVDAIERLKTYYDHGVLGLLAGLAHDVPHSPLSTMFAMGGFATMGLTAVAPYVINGIALSLVLGAMVGLFGLPILLSALIVAILALTTLSQWTITTFHPDLFAGLLVGLTCLLVLHHALSSTRTLRHVVSIGLVAGLALLAKPTAVVAASGLLLSVLAISHLLVPEPGTRRGALPSKARLLYAAPGILIAAALFAVYLVLGWTHLLDYITMVLLSHAGEFAGAQGASFQFSFYAIELHRFFGLHLIILAIGLLAILILWMRGRVDARLVAGLIALAVVCYIGLTLQKVKTLFFGGYLYGIVLALFVATAAGLARTALTSRYRSFALPALSTTLVLAVLAYSDQQPRIPSSDRELSQRILGEAYAFLKTRLELSGDHITGADPTRLFVAFDFPFVGRSLHFHALIHDVPIVYLPTAMASGIFEPQIADADVVLIPSQEAANAIIAQFPLPITRRIGEMISHIEKTSELRLKRTIETTYGPYFIYARPVLGIHAGVGWNTIEGPYPQWNLQRKVRWARVPNAALIADSEEAFSGELVLRCYAPMRTELTVAVNGLPTVRTSLTTQFDTIRVPVTFPGPGRQVIDLRIKPEVARPAGSIGLLCEQASFAALQPPPGASALTTTN
jgi:hypothetical protein